METQKPREDTISRRAQSGVFKAADRLRGRRLQCWFGEMAEKKLLETGKNNFSSGYGHKPELKGYLDLEVRHFKSMSVRKGAAFKVIFRWAGGSQDIFRLF